MFWNKKKDEGSSNMPAAKPVLFNEHLGDVSRERSNEPEGFEEDKEVGDYDGSDESEEEQGLEELHHSLPSFPDSPIKEGFSQSAIKDAVGEEGSNDGKESNSEELPELPDDEKEMIPSMKHQGTSPKVVEMPESKMKSYGKEIKESKENVSFKDKASKSGDVFVKIDKFYSAKKALNSISGKLVEIDDLLKKIRETKIREEQELSGWEKEIENVKSKVQEVRESIFEGE